MKRGQVYYADLRPVVGCEQGGIRPCVIIQNDAGNQYSSTVIVAAMTTKDKKELPTHIAVSAEDYCLDSNTTVLLEQLRTIDKRRLQSFVGRLSDGTMRRVDEALHISLGLMIVLVILIIYITILVGIYMYCCEEMFSDPKYEERIKEREKKVKQMEDKE